MFDKICKKYTSVKTPEYFLNLKLPQKFDCPCKWRRINFLLKNLVKSFIIILTVQLFSDNFVGYGEQLHPNAPNSKYKTTSNDYGWRVPDSTANTIRFVAPSRTKFSTVQSSNAKFSSQPHQKYYI